MSPEPDITAARQQLTPLFWRNETSGAVADAVMQYLDWCCKEASQPTEKQFDILRFYCQQWVDSPVWQGPGPGLAKLRRDIREVKDLHQLSLWLHDALKEGIDPL